MRSFIAIAALAAIFSGYPALAEEEATRPPVRMETDQQAKAFVFIIDDEPVAMLDEEGLHVLGGIDYGLSLTDIGPDSVKKKIASTTKEAARE